MVLSVINSSGQSH